MFRKLAKNALGATAVGLFSLGLVALVAMPVLAQLRSFAPRSETTQQTAYWRFTVNFNSCPLPVAAGNCSFKVGAVPYNAFLVRGYQQIITAFNSTTTDTLAIGTSAGSGNIVAAQSTHGAAGVGTALTMASLGLGTSTGVTGMGIAQTGTLGGFDLWATIAYTGATAATAGQAIIVLEYISPNDGSCTAVPTGATAPAC